jgi:hypothetical protein
LEEGLHGLASANLRRRKPGKAFQHKGAARRAATKEFEQEKRKQRVEDFAENAEFSQIALQGRKEETA